MENTTNTTNDMKYYKCIHSQCTVKNDDERLIRPSFASIQKLEEALIVKSSVDCPLLLCKKHYSLLYRQFVLTESTCASCEAKPKSGTMFSCHSPDPYTVALHLGSEQPIQEDEVLCGSCYKLHLFILNSLDKAPGSDQRLKKDNELWSSLCTEDSTNSINKSVLDSWK